MCCSFKKTAEQCGEKGVFTGSPIRESLKIGNKEIAAKMCNFKNIKPVILIIGGSSGAVYINKVVISSLKELTKNFNIIHIVGNGNKTRNNIPGYIQFEYLKDIENYLALADIVVSRAGSNSINEFLYLIKPMLLIPLPKSASRGDQLLNTKEFLEHNYCEVLYQEALTPQTLQIAINKLYKNRNLIIENMKKSGTKNGIDEIYKLIVKYTKYSL